MSLYELIKDIPMFAQFTEEDKRGFAQLEHSVLAFKKGDHIIREGSLNTSLYLLLRGSAEVTKSGYDSPIAVLKAGSVFGEISFLTSRPRHNNVLARENSLMIKIDDNLLTKVKPEVRDKIKNHLIELLAERLDAMNAALSKIAAFARGYAVL